MAQYTSNDHQYINNSRLNVKFYDLWINRHPEIPILSEANMRTILYHSPRHYSVDAYEELLTRRFKADFLVLPSVVIEIQGGTFMAQSRHNTGVGLAGSFEKLNIYSELGYRVFQLDTRMIIPDWVDRIASASR